MIKNDPPKPPVPGYQGETLGILPSVTCIGIPSVSGSNAHTGLISPTMAEVGLSWNRLDVGPLALKFSQQCHQWENKLSFNESIQHDL